MICVAMGGGGGTNLRQIWMFFLAWYLTLFLVAKVMASQMPQLMTYFQSKDVWL